MQRGDLLLMLLLGFIGYYLSSYFDFLGLQYVSVGLERIVLYLNPTLVLLISAIALKKRISARQWLAMGVAVVLVSMGMLLTVAREPRT